MFLLQWELLKVTRDREEATANFQFQIRFLKTSDRKPCSALVSLHGKNVQLLYLYDEWTDPG
jgi:hypothetical protein